MHSNSRQEEKRERQETDKDRHLGLWRKETKGDVASVVSVACFSSLGDGNAILETKMNFLMFTPTRDGLFFKEDPHTIF